MKIFNLFLTLILINVAFANKVFAQEELNSETDVEQQEFMQEEDTDEVDAGPEESSTVSKDKESMDALDIILSFSKKNSLMFNDEEIDLINKAFISHYNDIPLETVIPDLFIRQSKLVNKSYKSLIQNPTQDQAEVVEEIITLDKKSYYLNSILYVSSDIWSLWLDGKKVSKTKNKIQNIKILDLNQNEAIFVWKVPVKFNKIFDEIVAAHRSKLSYFSGDYSDEYYLHNNKNIVIDFNRRLVGFIMKPNQTFLIESMQILEGNIDPETITNLLAYAAGNSSEKTNKKVIALRKYLDRM